MRISDIALGEKIEICDNDDCKATFAYTKEDVNTTPLSKLADIDVIEDIYPQHEMRYNRHYVICPVCGKFIHLTTFPQIIKKGSKLYDND